MIGETIDRQASRVIGGSESLLIIRDWGALETCSLLAGFARLFGRIAQIVGPDCPIVFQIAGLSTPTTPILLIFQAKVLIFAFKLLNTDPGKI